MNIRTRLTFQFATIGAVLMILSSVTIYYFSSNYRQENFYDRLKDRAANTAALIINLDSASLGLLKPEHDRRKMLPDERMKIYRLKYDELIYNPFLIFSTDSSNTLPADLGLIDRVRLKREVHFALNDYEVLGFLVLDRYNNSYVVFATAKDLAGFEKLRNLRAVLISVFIGSVFLLVMAGWFYSGRAMSPISRVVRQVEKITESRLDLRVSEGREDDEIAKLARTFNAMLNRIENAFNVQKNFIANASHELRTPLTAITGQLEVTLMKSRNSDEYRKVIESVLEDIRSLNDVSNRLLILAQASAEKNAADFKPIRVDEIIAQAQADLLRSKKDYGIAISIDEAIEDEMLLKIKGDESLLKTAFINLMDNGCKYSGDHKVWVDISTHNGKLSIQFVDHGIGMSDDDLKLIFQPFYRGKNAESFRGYGIGLSLVERIVKLQGGSIDVRSILNKGTTITVTFPILV